MVRLPSPIEEAWQQAQNERNEAAPAPAPGIEDSVQNEEVVRDEPVVEAPPAQPEEDWKKRFVEYKRSTDTTIHELRQLLAQREADRAAQTHQLEQMQQQISQLRQSAPQDYLPQGVLSEEDIEVLGSENAQRIAKLASAHADRVRKEQEEKINALVRKINERENKDVQSQIKQSNESFWNSVKEIVPDAAEIDVDPRFSDFLNTSDPRSGKTWRDLGFAAKQSWDVERLASIYTKFKEANKPKTRESEVVPRGASGNNTPSQSTTSGKIWTRAEYERAVMDAVRGGPPSPQKMQQVDKLHAEFLQALREGRVR
jgi:hypothetical protein